MNKSEREKIYQYWYWKDLWLSDDVLYMRKDIKSVNVTKQTTWKTLLQLHGRKCLTRLWAIYSVFLSLDLMTKEYLKIKKIGALNELL